MIQRLEPGRREGAMGMAGRRRIRGNELPAWARHSNGSRTYDGGLPDRRGRASGGGASTTRWWRGRGCQQEGCGPSSATVGARSSLEIMGLGDPLSFGEAWRFGGAPGGAKENDAATRRGTARWVERVGFLCPSPLSILSRGRTDRRLRVLITPACPRTLRAHAGALREGKVCYGWIAPGAAWAHWGRLARAELRRTLPEKKAIFFFVLFFVFGEATAGPPAGFFFFYFFFVAQGPKRFLVEIGSGPRP